MKTSHRDLIRISAKTLGELSLEAFCPRCFWLKLRVQHRLPFQVFPGIFASIDGYSKRVVEGWFDRHGGPPPWLMELGPIVGYRPPPHHSKFNIVDERFGIHLTGTPDAVFVTENRSYIIGDYKTARFTRTQDELLPMYRVQLNAYAKIGEQYGFAPVTGLGLIYFEPQTDPDTVPDDPYRQDGFRLDFAAHVLPVALDPASIDPLLARVRKLYDIAQPPPGLSGCKNCLLVDQLLTTAGGAMASHCVLVG